MIKQGSSCIMNQVEEFWAVYQYMKRADELPVVTDVHLFKKGIMPVWEDEQNAEGGKWILRLKKGISARMWEELVFLLNTTLDYRSL